MFIPGLSYNQPQLHWNVSWNTTGITFKNNFTVGIQPRGIFIDNEDYFYFAHYHGNEIRRWSSVNSNKNPDIISSGPLFNLGTLFVTEDKDIFFENGLQIGQILKRSINGTNNNTFVGQFSSNCFGLFIDINNTFYCSLHLEHRIATLSLNDNTSIITTRAGNGTAGSSSYLLDGPWGIYVDTNFDLYVAEGYNAQVRLFRHGETNGTVVAGQGIPNSLFFQFPTDVILDANHYLYIADNQHHRIIRVGLNTFQCLAGCSSTPGFTADHLNIAIAIQFDSCGNIYVADEFNHRIQQFLLISGCIRKFHFHDIFVDTNFHIQGTFTTGMTSQPSTIPLSFQPIICSNPILMGSFCNITNIPCSIVQPCLNRGFCSNSNSTARGYICICLNGFNGSECQFDSRLCQSNLCLNNGN